MRVTLKEILRGCRYDLKKHLSKRDKWIRDWPGQVHSTYLSLMSLMCIVSFILPIVTFLCVSGMT